MELPINYDLASPEIRREARAQYITNQKGQCYYCDTLLKEEPSPEVRAKAINKKLFPVGFFNWPVHLHHSHTTGLTIGAVHSLCNAVLWQYYGE